MPTTHAEAVAAGLTPVERARYVAYVALCRSQGREPITALDAAAQCRKVRNAPAGPPNLAGDGTNGSKHTRGERGEP